MKALIKEERGTAIIMVALMMVVLSGFAALAIDGGNLYFRHTRLQDIADACALAACHQLGEEKNDALKESAAFDKAVDYVGKNGLTAIKCSGTLCEDITYKGEPGVMKVSFPEAYEVKVDISINSKLYFARILGFNQTPVNVSAIAGLVVAEEHTGGFAPLCYFWEDEPIPEGVYELSLSPQNDGGGVSGNYGYIAYEPNDFFNYLQYGYPGTLSIYKGTESYYTDFNTPYNTVLTKTGANEGPLDQSMQYRIDYCNQYHGGACTPENYKKNCPRIVILPMVAPQFWEANGKKYLHILGFTRFYIISYNKDTKTLTGQFIETVDETTANGGVPKDEYQIQSVKLVE